MHADIGSLLDRPFDLATECPVRIRLYRVRTPRRRVLAFVIHHIAFDGWSADVVLRDLTRLYTANRTGVGVTHGTADDNLSEINSVSVRKADFTLVACADVHP